MGISKTSDWRKNWDKKFWEIFVKCEKNHYRCFTQYENRNFIKTEIRLLNHRSLNEIVTTWRPVWKFFIYNAIKLLRFFALLIDDPSYRFPFIIRN